MKQVFYTGSEPVLHVKVGELKPGLNEVHRDDVAEQLLAAGRITGQFLSGDELARYQVTRSSDGARWDEATGTWRQPEPPAPAIVDQPGKAVQPAAPSRRARERKE